MGLRFRDKTCGAMAIRCAFVAIVYFSLNQAFTIRADDECPIGGAVYVRTVAAGPQTNGLVWVQFDVAGGTNGLRYDVFVTGSLAANQWSWVTDTFTCAAVFLPDQ